MRFERSCVEHGVQLLQKQWLILDREKNPKRSLVAEPVGHTDFTLKGP